MINSPNIFGITPSDVLIRTCVIAAINDLRKNPFLLDHVFNWFSKDELTRNQYGDAERQNAKDWFLKNEIFVSMNFRADDPKFPLISIGLQSSTEDYSTLGDVDSQVSEDINSEEIDNSINSIVGPFTPKSYDPATGIVTLPDGFTTSDIFIDNIFFSTKDSEGFVIQDVLDQSRFTIPTGVTVDFSGANVLAKDAFYSVQIESCIFKEVYVLKCIVAADPIFLLYLHSIMQYILLRYKQKFLEERGFDRSVISSGPIYQYTGGQNTSEIFWSRDITISGYCRQYWPKIISSKLNGIKLNGIEIIGEPGTPKALLSQVKDQGWGMLGDFDEND